MQAGERPYRRVLLFLLSGMSLLVALAGRVQQHPSYTLVTLAWLLAMLAFAAACWELDRRRSDLRALDLNWSAVDTLLVIATVAVAVALRVPALGRVPVTMLGDEGAMALEAVRAIQHEHTDPFATGWHSHPLTWSFLQSFCLRAFGYSVAGTRMLSALVGSASVATTYFFSRLLYRRRVAATTALLLATYHFHIHFSRLAVFNIADPLFGTAILGALTVGLRTRRSLALGVAGLILGLTLYFYPGARLFILLVALLGLSPLVRSFLERGRRSVVRGWWPALLIVGGGVTAAAPVLQTYSKEPESFTARLRANTITEPGWLRDEARSSGQSTARVLFSQFERAALAFTIYPSTDDFYDDRRPLLWGLAAPLMLIGFVLALLRFSQWAYRLPLLWFLLAVSFGGALLKNPPESARYVTLAPVACIFIALAIDQALIVLVWLRPGRPPLPQFLVTALTLYLAATSVAGYFYDYLPHEQPGGPNTHAANALARYLQQQPAGTKVWFLGMPRMYYHGFPMLDFLARQVDGADALTLWVMPAPEPGRTTIYAVLPEHRAELEATEARYPGGEQQTLTWPTEPGPMVYVYRVPAAVTRCAGIGQGAYSRCPPDTHP